MRPGAAEPQRTPDVLLPDEFVDSIRMPKGDVAWAKGATHD